MTDSIIERVRNAIQNEGQHPPLHRELMRRHRLEWPTLWRALDELLIVPPAQEPWAAIEPDRRFGRDGYYVTWGIYEDSPYAGAWRWTEGSAKIKATNMLSKLHHDRAEVVRRERQRYRIKP